MRSGNPGNRWADALGATAGSLALPVAIVAAAALAGIATAVIGGAAGNRAIYYVAVFSLFVAGGIVAATRPEPLRFVFLALIACFPFVYAVVPPGRFGVTVFDVVMVALTVGLIAKRMVAASPAGAQLFPTKSLLIAWLLSVPCVVLSQFPTLSLLVFVLNFAIYAFFLLALEELGREGGLERLVLLLSIVQLVMAAGFFIDHVLHVNLSLRGSNVNQLTFTGMEIYRAGGFFQDPQKGGAFLACMITFLLILAVRGRLRGMRMRFVVWAAIAAGSAALITTISRSAIVACLVVSGSALFAFNRWNAAVKLLTIGCVMIVAMVMAMVPAETWLNLVPAAVAERFVTMGRDLEIRLTIWFDTWSMFASHPLTGIGLGSFQHYLVETQPTVFNYYGIGEGTGIPYIPDQPENGYLKILYEGGIAGSLAASLVAGDALRRAIAVIAGKHVDPDARTEGIAALAALMVFGATFVTLFTLSDQRIAGLLAFLLAVIWHRSLERAPTSHTA